MGVYSGIALDNVTINSGSAVLDSMRVPGNSPATKTTAFAVGAYENFIVCSGAGSITVTLPSAAASVGRVIVIKTIAAQTVVSNASNVLPIGSATAGTAILAGTAGAWAMLVSNGTNWVIMAS
jgi:hypothetical protein